MHPVIGLICLLMCVPNFISAQTPLEDVSVPIEIQLELVFKQYDDCIKAALIGQTVVLTFKDLGDIRTLEIGPKENLMLCKNDAYRLRRKAMEVLKTELKILREFKLKAMEEED